MKNASRRGVLTPAIELWSFKSPEGLPSPHFGSVSVILTLFQKWGCNKHYLLARLEPLFGVVIAISKLNSKWTPKKEETIQLEGVVENAKNEYIGWKW
jgi:hypothetical protein